MNPTCQQITDLAASINDQLAQKDQAIALLQQQVADLSKPQPVVISNIQAVMPETLWYEARDASAPKTGPHGTISIVPSNPATVDFRPIRIDGIHTDNCYCLRRLYSTLTSAQKATLETAKEFSLSCDYLFNPLANVQAGELDYQIRKSSGVVINIGPQLLPTSRGWMIRGFDFVNKDWVPLGVKASVIPTKPTHLELYATCDDKVVQFTRVVVDGISSPVTFSHPTSMSAPGQPYINAAFQLDATADGKAYTAQISNFQVTFA